LMSSGVLLMTILVHGGAAISVGLALATASPWLRRAMVTAVGFTVVGILAMRSLLALLVSRTSYSARERLWSVALWDIVVTILAVCLSLWTIWVWQRRLHGASKPKPFIATDLHGVRTKTG
jgi:hypothetical protein